MWQTMKKSNGKLSLPNAIELNHTVHSNMSQSEMAYLFSFVVFCKYSHWSERFIGMKISRIFSDYYWMDGIYTEMAQFTNFSHEVHRQNDNHKTTITTNFIEYAKQWINDLFSYEIICVICCILHNNLCNTFEWLRKFPSISSVIDIVCFYGCILPSTWDLPTLPSKIVSNATRHAVWMLSIHFHRTITMCCLQDI